MSGLEALVVGGVDYGESDRIVHLLTDQGRLSLYAHGAKKSRRRFAGALEPFTTVLVQVDQRKIGSIGTMTSATVEDPRLGIRRDLLRITMAGYACELGARLAPEGDAGKDLYALVVSTLDRLAGQREVLAAVRQAFELMLLDLIGYRPEIDHCVICGGDPGWIDLERGGALCGEHGSGAQALGPKTAAWMRALLLRPQGFDERAGFDEAWAAAAARRLSRPLAAFYRSLLDQPLRTVSLLEQALRDE